MILLATWSLDSLRTAYGRDPYLGVLTQPRSRHNYRTLAGDGIVWAADNDGFQGVDSDAYLRMLDRISRYPTGCKWVTVPDVVGDWKATNYNWSEWRDLVEGYGIPLAYVAQDFVPCDQVPWDEMACLFIGGTDAYKTSDAAEGLCREAKDRGKWVHIGRVNTRGRFHRAAAMGADSVDGTKWTRWARTYRAEMLGLLHGGRAQSLCRGW